MEDKRSREKRGIWTLLLTAQTRSNLALQRNREHVVDLLTSKVTVIV